MIEIEFVDASPGGAEEWNIILNDQTVGSILVVLRKPEVLEILDVSIRRQFRSQISVAGVRRILSLLKQQYPSASEIVGVRVTGVRALKSDVETEEMGKVIPFEEGKTTRVKLRGLE